MTIKISDKAKAILALCEEKEILRERANELNKDTLDLIRRIKGVSDEQALVLNKMAELDKAIETISMTVKETYGL